MTPSNPAHGPLSGFNPTTGAVTYTPDPGFSGADNFQFTVNDSSNADSNTATVSITVTNTAPTADDQSLSTPKGVDLPITLTFTDPDFTETITFNDPSTPAHGTLSGFNPTTGAVTYTPDPGFSGADNFQFTVHDSSNAVSNTATVSITVTNTAPTAEDQSLSTPKGVDLPITLTFTDPDFTETITFNDPSTPAHGTLIWL